MPEIQMPKLSDTMTEGTLVSWKKKKGDQVSAGEVLAEIETDKATMEWESPEDGTLTEIYVQEGGKLNVGDRIAFIGGKGEEAPKAEKKENEAEERPPAVEKPEEARVRASPVARRIAAELGVDLSSVKGTGPDGRVTESDVRAAAKSVAAVADRAGAKAEAKTAPPVKSGESARIQLSGMRKIIAQRLVESLGPVPHFYLTIDVNAGPLMEARSELKSAGEGADAAKITVNDFVLKAAVVAAVKVPRVNASFDNDAIVQYADVELGVAVAIEDGLLTPVIRAAQDKSLREISALAKDLAHRARNKRMKP